MWTRFVIPAGLLLGQLPARSFSEHYGSVGCRMRSLPSYSELTARLESVPGKPTWFLVPGCTHLLQVGGFYITDIAAWISWMKYLSFIFYSYNLLLKVSVSGRTIRLTPSQPPTFHCPAILERRDAKWYE